MDIHNTLEVLTFFGDILKVSRVVLADGKVTPIEVALEGRKLVMPGAAAIRDLKSLPQEILDLDGEEYTQLKASVEKVKAELDQFLAVARNKNTPKSAPA